MNSKTRKIIITSIVLIFATIGVILTGYLSYPKFKKTTKPLTYEEAKETSKEMADKQKEYEKIKEEVEKNSNTTKSEREKQKEVKKTKEYEEYEKLTEKEKKNINIIPEKEEIPKEKINNIIEDQKEDIKEEQENEEQENEEQEEEKEEEQEIVEEEIPKAFDLREKININTKNISSNSIAWISAALNTVETNVSLKNGKDYSFSMQHVNYLTSNLLYGYRELDSSGNFSYFKKYLMQSGGVVLEKEVPDNKNYGENKYSKFIDMTPIVDVTEVVEFPTYNKNYNEYTAEEVEKLRNAIKRHIMRNGSLYATFFNGNHVDDNYYTAADKESYIWANAPVNIIGWDDDYSKEKFDYKGQSPENDGAYIVKGPFNSSGYAYVSYEDAFIENNLSGIVSTSIDDKTTIDFDNIKTEELKKQIIMNYYYALIEKNDKKYVSKLLLSNIQFLDIKNDKFDFNELKMLSNLNSLSITNANINSIEEIPKNNLDTLSFLDLSNNNIKDASPLKDANISTIILSGNENIKNYGVIKNAGNLQIANCGLNELEPIESTNIYALDISNNNITNINGIEEKYMISTLKVGGNNILDYSPINQLKQNGISNTEGYNQWLTLDLSNTGITDISSINNLQVDTLILSKNNINSLQGLQLSEYTKSLYLSDNNIETLDGFIIPEGLTSLDISNNKLKDISNFDSNNINSINLSNNKDIKGYGELKVQDLTMNDCNITDVQELSKLPNVISLTVDNNSITDISDISKIKNLGSLSINNNSKSITGKLVNDNIRSLNVINTKISEKLELDCSNLGIVSTSDIKFNTNFLKSDYNSMVYYDITLNEDIMNQKGESNINYKMYYDSIFPSVKAEVKNNEILLEEPYMDAYKDTTTVINTDKLAISKDRKKLILLDNSLDTIDIYYSTTNNNNYFSGKLPIEFKKSSSLIDSIKNVLFK